MIIPKNTWMNNPQYLAQIGHVLGGYGLIITTTLFTIVFNGGWLPIYIVLGVGIVLASIKEFWYDLKFELPTQSFMDSLEDWIFYMVGALVGMIVSLIVMGVK